MKAGGPAESGLQTCHNKYLAVNLPNNLGFQGGSEGFTGVFKGFFKRALKPYIAPTNSLATPAQAHHIQECEMNGWQRLWVLVSLVLGIATVVGGYKNMTMESDLTERYESSITVREGEIESIKRREAGIKPINRYDESARSVGEVENSIGELSGRYRQDLEQLPAKQLRHSLAYLGAWLGMCIGMYVIGFMLSWVYRGFKSS